MSQNEENLEEKKLNLKSIRTRKIGKNQAVIS